MDVAKQLPGLELREADLGGIRVRYIVGGSGTPVVLLHGLGGAAANWVELLATVLARYRVVALDLPGHGGSERLPPGVGIGAFADVVAALVEREGAGPALVVGHSLGGLVALRLAHRRPELVAGLLLVAPAGIRSSDRVARTAIFLTGHLQPARWVAPFRHRLAERAWYRRALFRPFFASDPLAVSPRVTVALLDAASEHQDVRTAGRALVQDDPRRDLDRVACPVIVLWGARDPQLPLDDAFEYTRRLRARLRVVADCGHLVIGERPHACLDALDELAGLVGRVGVEA